MSQELEPKLSTVSRGFLTLAGHKATVKSRGETSAPAGSSGCASATFQVSGPATSPHGAGRSYESNHHVSVIKMAQHEIGLQ